MQFLLLLIQMGHMFYRILIIIDINIAIDGRGKPFLSFPAAAAEEPIYPPATGQHPIAPPYWRSDA